MVFQIDHELQESCHNLSTILSETSMFSLPSSESQPARQCSGAGVGLAALAAVHLFGGGVAIGNSDSCGLPGDFVACQDEKKPNAENIWQLSEYQDVLTQFVTELSTDSDEKFFLVKNKLAALDAIKAEIASTLNLNWAFSEEQFVFSEQKLHILREFKQMLFSKQQSNFNFDTLSSLFATIHSSTKS